MFSRTEKFSSKITTSLSFHFLKKRLHKNHIKINFTKFLKYFSLYSTTALHIPNRTSFKNPFQHSFPPNIHTLFLKEYMFLYLLSNSHLKVFKNTFKRYFLIKINLFDMMECHVKILGKMSAYQNILLFPVHLCLRN